MSIFGGTKSSSRIGNLGEKLLSAGAIMNGDYGPAAQIANPAQRKSDLSEAERVRRAESAQRALVEFLEPAFATVHATYTNRLKDLAASTPWEAGKITALANATRIAEEVRAQIVALVLDGADAGHKIDHAKRIERMTPAQRRLLNIGAF